MTEYAQIIRHVDDIEGVGKMITYSWDGDPHWPVKIGWVGIRQMDIQKLPWNLRLIERDALRDTGTYIRSDAWFPFGMWLLVKYRVRNFLFGVKCRIIYTFHVWGMGYTRESEYPAWSDIIRKRL
jgi:hypothetical protein